MTRQEKDPLGAVEVPSEALYGAQTVRAVQNFPISSQKAHPALLRAYLRIKRAAAVVNLEAGALPAPHSRLIQEGIDSLLRTPGWESHFPVDAYQAGAGTSQNMNVNEVVANCANRLDGKALGTYEPVHPNDHVNRSQSTNDTYPTAMRLSALETSKDVGAELQKLADSLQQKATAWRLLPKSARTHLQDAVPMTLGQEFGAYAHTVRRLADWVERGRDGLRELGIGGSAAGTGLTVPSLYPSRMTEELSRLTGEHLRLSPHLCEAMQSQSPVLCYMHMLHLVAIELTRMCNDLRLLASGPMTGLAEILLPAVQPGSSIMPGKVNPSILEMVNQVCYSVLGYHQSVSFCTQAGQLELNVMMPIMAFSVNEANGITAAALRQLRLRCIDGLEPNVAKMQKFFESTPQVATALSPKLGYETTAALVKESLAKGMSVMDLVREQALVPEEELKRLLDVESLTGVKSS
jgi:aspartate ammonia-lyase